MKGTTFKSAVAGLFFLAGSVLAAEQCVCSPENMRKTVIVIEMPEQYSALEATETVTVASSKATSFATKLIESSSSATKVYSAPTGLAYTPPKFERPPKDDGKQQPPMHNTTHTFKPCSAPKIDRADPKNLIPAKNVSLAYSAGPEQKPKAQKVNNKNATVVQDEDEDEGDKEDSTTQGSIDMDLAFKYPAVVLEHVESVSEVSCGDDLLTVSFASSAGFEEAVKDWDTNGEPFILITGALDAGCASEFERGFFIVEDISTDADTLTIEVTATKGDLPDLAGEMEMTFTSLPAATLMRRLTLSPSYSLQFAEGLDGRTTIFTDGKYIDIAAEEAWFSTKLTFSGKLKYNFWRFKVQELYFDLDAEFGSSAVVSAQIQAAFQEAVQYKPDDLAYSLIDVPGIVSLGPGLAFGLHVNVEASAAVDLYAGVDVSLPAGRVHVDFLDGFKTTTSGWEPEYNSFVNASQSADVSLEVGADLSVMLQFKLLGGLVDLSSGFTASPGFDNTFKLRGEQQASVNGTLKGISAGLDVPRDAISCADTNGVEFVSDFLFSLRAFATKWWEKELYAVRVPIVDYCMSF